LYRRLFLPVIRRADFWLANSRATLGAAVEAGMDPDRVHLLHPGVALPELRPEEDAVRLWRQQRDLGKGPILLSVGRLTRRKGLREVIHHVLPQILSVWPNAILVVIGGEPINALTTGQVGSEGLRHAAHQVGAANNVRILGPVSDDELALAYHAASLHVFPVLDIPGDMEGFGMVAVEAAAHGLPTVAFAVGGVPDAVLPGASGELLAPGDYAGMASLIIDYLRFGKSARLTESCREFAQRFSWDRFGASLTHILDQRLNASIA
jgi:phosphatidylinositol alpha-1,6-mannosyltransferase